MSRAGTRGGRGRKRRRAALAVLFLLAGVTPVLLATTAEQATALPPGFAQQTVISGLTQPMDVEFSPDGDVYVAEKSGLVKRFDGLADTTATTVLDLRTQVHNQWDRGLMSIALAPDFPADPSVWALYAHDAAIGGTAPRWGTPGAVADPCPTPPGATADGCVISGRLSKFNATLPGGGTEQVLVEDWCQQYPSHSVGDLAFGPDGYLYASAGDGASFNFADYGQDGSPVNPCGDPPGGVGGSMTVPNAEGGALRAQDVQTLTDPTGLDGTVIRIDPDTGAGAPGNPLATSSDANARRVVANGLRNPFRMTFRPGTDELFIGDVGWSSWEEIDRLQNPIDGTVDNFGWPCREGNGTNGYNGLGLTMCNRIANGTVPTVAPHFTYQHGQPVLTGDGCAAAGSSSSGVAFYEGDSYPAAYDGALFFADYSRQCIWAMFPDANGVPDPATRISFQTGIFPVALESGPNGDIFYADIAAGAIRRITATGGNVPPTATITATPSSGALPLTVSLSAAGSSDVEPGTLTYAWDLDGDGAYDDATGLTASRTYIVAGEYHPVVRVTDSGGQSSTATTRVLAGTTPPVPTMASPTSTFTWSAGETISFSGSATDADDGALPASALDWQAILHHCVSADACHQHPITTIEGVSSGSFAAPDHEYPAYVELRLTATDSAGVATTTSRLLSPKVRELRIVTSPPGLAATVSSRSGTGPFTVPVIPGSRHTLSTLATQSVGGQSYTFTGWSDGGARVHDITAAATDQTLTATFQPTTGGDASLVAAYGFDEGSGASLQDRSGRGNNGTVSGATWDPAGGHTGGTLSFDGVNDIVNVPDSASLNLTTGMTLEAWVRPTVATGWRTAVMKEAPGGLRYALYSSGADQPSTFINTGGGDVGVEAPSALPVNAWTHVAATYDGSALRFYVGGSLVATQAHTGALATSTSPLRLGGNTVWGEWFSGRLDDVRIYNRALSAAEIVADRDTPVSADTEAPTAPAGLAATGGLGSVALSWTAATDNVGVTAYDVHRSTTAGFTPSAANRIASPSGTSYGDTGLAAGTYYYRVIARDAAGNASPASNQTSAVVTGDTTPPTVSVTAPAAGSTVSGMVAVSANAADAGGVAGVQFRVDGAALGAEDTSSPYSVQWNTAAIANGSHTLTAVARDAAGNPTTSAPVTVTVSNAVPTNLIAAYSFDGGSGPSLADNTGRGHTGAISGATWSTSGHSGGALSFDGVNDSVSIADAADLDLTTGMTLEAWVRPTARTGWATAVMKERAGALDYALYAGDGADRPSGWNRIGTAEADATGPTALPLATWSHLAVTYDGTTLRLYVNGTEVATRARSGPMTTSTGVLRLGGNGVWGEYFNGLLDDVRVFNVARTAAQITADRDTPVT